MHAITIMLFVLAWTIVVFPCLCSHAFVSIYTEPKYKIYKSTKNDSKFPATKITVGIVQLTNLFLQCEHHVFVTLNVIKKCY